MILKKLIPTLITCCVSLLLLTSVPTLPADAGEKPMPQATGETVVTTEAPAIENGTLTKNEIRTGNDPQTETGPQTELAPADKENDGKIPIQPETETPPHTDALFRDVEASAWYAPYVNELAKRGILSGRGNHFFAPADNVTRAEFAKILAVFSNANIHGYNGTSKFPDVAANSWYNTYVNWAYDKKIVLGSNGFFLPDKPITRQEMAVMVVRYARNVLGLAFPGTGTYYAFPDRSKVAPWALPEVTGLMKAGVINGYEDGSFRPANNATRAETARIISAFDASTPFLTDIGFCWDDIKYIVHGGGIYDGHVTTNSKEAFDNAYASGHYFMEVDLRWTTDDEIVCIHYWANDITPRCSYCEFMNLKIYGSMTPMSLATLATWMRQHPEVYIITDIKARNIVALTRIHDEYPDLVNRFIPQIYEPEEYNTVANMGFQNIILTMYMMDWNTVMDTDYISSFARSHRLLGITMDETIATADYIRALSDSGTLLFAHTINDITQIRQLHNYGIDGVYTDNLF